MNRCVLTMLCLCGIHTYAIAQQQEEEHIPAAITQQLENEAANTNASSDDDAQWQQLDMLAAHRLQLNDADEAALQSLGLLTPLQVGNLLAYRRLLGDLVSIYELQAVPGFEPEVIQRILPYVKVGNDLAPHYSLRDYFSKGERTLLLRYGRVLEKAKGYRHTDSTLPFYRGSPDKAFIRYRYTFGRYASWGVVMKKDAGEAFFRGGQRQGFDFYSAHIFLRNYRKIRAFALGDYTVNLGQGLIQWHAMAYSKGAAVMQVKREGDVLRPYTSAGEYYFFRGAAITLQQQAWQLTAFTSFRRLDGSMATDSLDGAQVSAINSSGYHRSEKEIAKKGTLQQWSAGTNIRHSGRRWQIGINGIWHHFTPPLQAGKAAYDQFDPGGDQVANASIDYSGNWRNLHLFGEAAVDMHGKPAVVQGLLMSLSPSLGLAALYRYYDKAYQSMYTKGFGDSYRTVNEQGLYTGITLKVNARLQLDAFGDLFYFPWIKYRANAPSQGYEWLLAATYTPNKRYTWALRCNSRRYEENVTVGRVKVLTPITLTHIRFQGSYQPGRVFHIQSRLEWSYYSVKAGAAQQGWLLAQDVAWHGRHLPLGVNARLARFLTGGYQSRIYAFEHSVRYDNAVSQLYGDGWQYYVNVSYKLRRGLVAWLRWHQTIYPGGGPIGTGWDAIPGGRKTMVQCQLQQQF
ncbi:ComEA family DNA-binding protein [Chitinophaga vietnamensis]|uniref:ComEA family DNA-binding protein n=1 Tax=Chitinophaga vietnamensis TaxID=2593957 RepID=UPI0011785523|nr:helix-hairpin-helix domain-containing protein [Chitinophaga vietnamensis]